jgi:ubiquinone/menaquinone biosynthesis C-methylase UbiE
MGFYGEHILPRLIDKSLSKPEVDVVRKETLERARGIVLEVGLGSGLNLPHYPTSVTRLLAVEPSLLARKIASRRIAQAPFPVEWVGTDGQSLAMQDETVDQVVSTLTLCTIASPERALKEMVRVLRPGGLLIFLEHGLSDNAGIVRWQKRLNGIQKTFCGGCHLTRRISELIESAELKIDDLANPRIKGMPKIAHFYRGTAHKAS